MQLSDDKREDFRSRLSRIEGQVRGVQRMVEEDRYCGDVLNQIHSVQQALKSVERKILRNHLETCLTDAVQSGDEEARQEGYDEFMNLLKTRI
ncbi:DNA-binding FrmR family transcriptional regulator [Salinibacter ruber]|jgi:DNA-binding FrmR family transcriptional regulator|uniref:DNA-binding FrmR family transcriptional regulator n=1 Tax=Salinibacter ruber TaxID=146919 RepID=A0A9X2TAD7_9BACT|nr:metal-sensitive transcriptional regulator [Salinibacter ruber]MCS3676318.1 DNA-binding FrmR family transcriptional regulator [Salinibacter ruber]MCS3679605.1 DNA-binding FrmR family transcriptional regulator [Salinibacter ruber]MCS4178666.1 DNA-binding FrmR family transcriptional regulator [Salinibacter ruber]